jgi:hypothetical protein
MKAIALFAVALFAAQEPPKPGREHEALKVFEGDWTFTGKFYMDPAQPPMEMNGTAPRPRRWCSAASTSTPT